MDILSVGFIGFLDSEQDKLPFGIKGAFQDPDLQLRRNVDGFLALRGVLLLLRAFGLSFFFEVLSINSLIDSARL